MEIKNITGNQVDTFVDRPKPSANEVLVNKKQEPTVVEAQNEKIEKSQDNLREAVDKLNKTAVVFDRSLRFQIHEKTNRTMVSVVDEVEDKVIRQIPREEILEMVAKMDDYLGLIFDKTA